MSTVHEHHQYEEGVLKLNAAITVLADEWYGAGGWFDDEAGRWAFLGLLEKSLWHLKVAAA